MGFLSAYIAAATMMGGLSGLYTEDKITVRNGVKRTSNPWDNIFLSKTERKGKTFEEIQAERKRKYESMHIESPHA